MSLYTRLIGIDRPRVSAHDFYAIAHEFKRGLITGNDARAFLRLSVSEGQEANAILSKVEDDTLTPEEVHQVLMIAERQRGLYDTESTLKARLGIA